MGGHNGGRNTSTSAGRGPSTNGFCRKVDIVGVGPEKPRTYKTGPRYAAITAQANGQAPSVRHPHEAPSFPAERSFGVRAARCRSPTRKLACGHSSPRACLRDFQPRAHFARQKIVSQFDDVAASLPRYVKLRHYPPASWRVKKRQRAARTPKLRSECQQSCLFPQPVSPLS